MTTPQQRFIADIYPSVRKVADETGVSAELLLAQAAAETGWGQKVLHGTNNLYNIKADPSWHGESKTFEVPEFRNRHKVMEDAKFRVYDSYEDSIKDRIKFVQENPTYAKHGLLDPGVKGNLVKEAQALQAAGYATDPDYAKNLIDIANGPTMRKGIALAEGRAEPEHVQGHGKPHAQAHGQAQSPGDHLRKGDEGGRIAELQTSLQKLGYTHPNGAALGADGKFGGNTELALKAFQRDHHLNEDGVAGPKTLEALQAAQQKAGATTLADPKHPAHGMYKQAEAGVHRIDREHGREPTLQSGQLAGSLTASAVIAQMSGIDHVVLNDDASKLYAVQGDPNAPFKSFAEVDVMRGLNTPLAQSTQIADEQLSRSAAQDQAQQVAPLTQQQARPQAPHVAGPSH
ncbi:MAG TPA: XVIPCD domain-containing protein [Luteibacter sp.]|uniref:XVIPCD domain-containing protein n=1 Tax=Luteibacter sp. TaxID=1886636 RepID=UPI002C3EA87E|nr:XVIPCD domain-containing protein [Luteibacter sp.]HVI55556.1 XVIPCD domain-containing protein [Luteibacter sp.]